MLPTRVSTVLYFWDHAEECMSNGKHSVMLLLVEIIVSTIYIFSCNNGFPV